MQDITVVYLVERSSLSPMEWLYSIRMESPAHIVGVIRPKKDFLVGLLIYLKSNNSQILFLNTIYYGNSNNKRRIGTCFEE